MRRVRARSRRAAAPPGGCRYWQRGRGATSGCSSVALSQALSPCTRPPRAAALHCSSLKSGPSLGCVPTLQPRRCEPVPCPLSGLHSRTGCSVSASTRVVCGVCSRRGAFAPELRVCLHKGGVRRVLPAVRYHRCSIAHGIPCSSGCLCQAAHTAGPGVCTRRAAFARRVGGNRPRLGFPPLGRPPGSTPPSSSIYVVTLRRRFFSDVFTA